MSLETENNPAPGRKRISPGHGPLCVCARCKRSNAFQEKKRKEHDEVIEKYLQGLPKDRVLLKLDDITIEAIKNKLPQLNEKFSFNVNFTVEDYRQFINELSNKSIFHYLSTL